VTENWQNRLDKSRNKADIIIAKNRHGKPETVHLSFFGEYCLFDNLNQYTQQTTNDTGFETPYASSTNEAATPSVADISDFPDDMI
jgi:hypothetical protein